MTEWGRHNAPNLSSASGFAWGLRESTRKLKDIKVSDEAQGSLFDIISLRAAVGFSLMLDGCERLHARGLGPASQREVIILRKVVDQTVRQNRGQVKGCTFLTHFQALLTRFLLSLESLRQSPFFVDQARKERGLEGQT